jgi:two-component system, OmpR family, phosphate regulon sensor histidine kinase PhoR
MIEDKRSRDWYKAVLDAIPDLILVKGDRSKLLWANKSFLDYYGMSQQQLEDIVDSPHSDPDDTIQYVKDDHRVFTSGTVLDIPSEPVTNASGDVRFYHTIKAPIFDAVGKVVHTVGCSRLIQDPEVVASSGRDREQRKLQINELRTFVHDIPLAVAMFDVKLRFLSYSQAWRDLFAYEGPALEGEFFDAFEPCVALTEPMTAAIHGHQRERRAGMALRTFSGREHIVDVDMRPWSMPSGETGGVIALLHDVTEATQARRELQRLNDELVQFNYRVSHDLLAPLKTVRGFIDLCDDELADGNLEALREYHDIMRQNVIRLGALVEDVLNLARADVRDVERTHIEIEPLVSEIFQKYRTSITEAAIEVSHDCAGVTLHSERVRVLQVLENLVSNAIKYHHPERQERRVAITARPGKPGEVVFQVQDNGIGFDPSQATAIFDIFKRATSKYPGSGLGLYIVRKHVDRLGGWVRVVSSRDDTIFEVSIPSAPPPPQEPRS